MDQNAISNIYNQRSHIITESASLALLVSISYLIQLFYSLTGSFVIYRIVLTLSLLMIFIAKKTLRLRFQPSISTLWIVMLLVIGCLMIQSGLTISSFMDWYTYFVGTVFVCALGEDEKVLKSSFKVIVFFGVLFAISVWIQFLFPQLYGIYLRVLPSETATQIQRLRTINGLLTGFSTNPGFTAGHIISALIVLFSNSQALKVNQGKSTFRTKFYALVLFSALLLTGKRGHLLAVIFSILLCYLINTRGKKRIVALNVIMILVVVIIPFLFLFSDFLLTVPVLGRLGDTIVGLINGNDVSNGRNGLFALALSQFNDRPIMGIGWGKFRASVIGVVTVMTQLDTHNIYLQLLCETGIVGFAFVVIPMLVFAIQSVKNIGIISNAYPNDAFLKCAGLYSLGYQLFFIVYGLSGNPLYDYNYAIMYFVSCAITALIHRKTRKELIT